jgi:hypothetical protein
VDNHVDKLHLYEKSCRRQTWFRTINQTLFWYHIKIAGCFQVRRACFSAEFLEACVEKKEDNNILCFCGKCGKMKSLRLPAHSENARKR